jgi:hypothetical protein
MLNRVRNSLSKFLTPIEVTYGSQILPPAEPREAPKAKENAHRRLTNPIPELEKIPGWWEGSYKVNHQASIRAMIAGDQERARIFAGRAREAQLSKIKAYMAKKGKV